MGAPQRGNYHEENLLRSKSQVEKYLLKNIAYPMYSLIQGI